MKTTTSRRLVRVSTGLAAATFIQVTLAPPQGWDWASGLTRSLVFLVALECFLSLVADRRGGSL